MLEFQRGLSIFVIWSKGKDSLFDKSLGLIVNVLSKH